MLRISPNLRWTSDQSYSYLVKRRHHNGSTAISCITDLLTGAFCRGRYTDGPELGFQCRTVRTAGNVQKWEVHRTAGLGSNDFPRLEVPSFAQPRYSVAGD